MGQLNETGKKIINITICIITTCCFNKLQAQQVGLVYTNKVAVLIGEPVKLTYAFAKNNVQLEPTFPTPKDFSKITIIETSNVISTNDSIKKEYTITSFDSLTFITPIVNTATFKIMNSLNIQFSYLPISALPDTLLPKYPLQQSSGIKNKNSFIKKIFLLIIVIVLLTVIVLLLFKRKAKKINSNNNSQNQINILLHSLSVSSNQNEAEKLYYNLYKLILLKTSINHTNAQNNTQQELIGLITNTAINNKLILIEVLKISSPTLYGKYYPTIEIQEKHISVVKNFVTKKNNSNA